MEKYTLTEDYAEDGKVIWKAGTTIGWDTAHALGLVKTKHPPKDAPEAPKLDKAK